MRPYNSVSLKIGKSIVAFEFAFFIPFNFRLLSIGFYLTSCMHICINHILDKYHQIYNKLELGQFLFYLQESIGLPSLAQSVQSLGGSNTTERTRSPRRYDEYWILTRLYFFLQNAYFQGKKLEKATFFLRSSSVNRRNNRSPIGV